MPQIDVATTIAAPASEQQQEKRTFAEGCFSIECIIFDTTRRNNCPYSATEIKSHIEKENALCHTLNSATGFTRTALIYLLVFEYFIYIFVKHTRNVVPFIGFEIINGIFQGGCGHVCFVDLKMVSLNIEEVV